MPAQPPRACFRPPSTNCPLPASAVLARLPGLGNEDAIHVTQDLLETDRLVEGGELSQGNRTLKNAPRAASAVASPET